MELDQWLTAGKRHPAPGIIVEKAVGKDLSHQFRDPNAAPDHCARASGTCLNAGAAGQAGRFLKLFCAASGYNRLPCPLALRAYLDAFSAVEASLLEPDDLWFS
jgi:hypothetical protein